MNIMVVSPANVGHSLEKRKRKRVINAKECQIDMGKALQQVFMAYHKALDMHNREIRLTPPQDRIRGMEASYFNSKLVQCLREYFGADVKRGKYGRIFLYINGYVILIKKLKNNDMPMNIKTHQTSFIENQMQGNLFSEEEDGASPIVFFGYSTNAIGEKVNPRLVYIDEGKVKWVLGEKEMPTSKEKTLFDLPVQHKDPKVKVKTKINIKRKTE